MKVTRREFNTGAAATLAGYSTGATAKPAPLHMPAEWHRHETCYMALCAAHGLYTQAEIKRIRKEQATVAKAIARFEPVVMLANPADVTLAKALCGPSVTIKPLAHYDVWTRDTLPSIVLDAHAKARAVSWNFNVWGEKFPGYDADRDLAHRFAATLNLPITRAAIIAEGGAIEVDGDGTLLTTESCLLNTNRNPGKTRKQIDDGLRKMTGAEKIIWLPGSKADAVTDGHVDGICRFVAPGVVLTEVSDDRYDPEFEDLRKTAKILENSVDAKGRKLEVIRLKRPRWAVMPKRGDDFAASYVNCYLPNDGIILPVFDDKKRDQEAFGVFRELFPNREIVQLRVNEICEGGGGIHCNTQHMPTENA